MITMNNNSLSQGDQHLINGSPQLGSSAPKMMMPGMSGMSATSNPMAAAAMMNQMTNAAAAHQMNPMGASLNLNDLKRLQQLQMQQQQQQQPGNSLLPLQQQPDASAALLQSFLGQKMQGMGMGMGSPAMAGKLLLQNQGGLFQTTNPGAGVMALPSPHSVFNRDGSRRMRGGVIEPFPEKLHRLLMEVEAAGRSDVISFVANGRAFSIHKPEHFFKEIVPLYFRQSRLSSFKRQLNLYGFELINTGPARGGYFHELFVKDRPELCRRMRRVAVKVGVKKEVAEDDASASQSVSSRKDEVDKGDKADKDDTNVAPKTTDNTEP